ncbi:MAG: GNAT family N-acetyltransferase [Candidatus Bathyarchaeota archaeon]|jgi:ribosomal protein S18 acetylase RimI-like enzyme|nr:GNAT family N-acetyltransferase [Candidatus Bathyarchaeota archaeon]
MAHGKNSSLRKKDFVDYVAVLEKTTRWKKNAASMLTGRLEQMKKGEQVWVAEVDTRGVGFMILAPNHDDSLEVDWLDVHPDFQRLGIGTLLLKKAVSVAKAKKKQALSIHTWESNQKTLGFAYKNGFEKYETIKNFYGKRKDAVRLKKNIL